MVASGTGREKAPEPQREGGNGFCEPRAEAGWDEMCEEGLNGKEKGLFLWVPAG